MTGARRSGATTAIERTVHIPPGYVNRLDEFLAASAQHVIAGWDTRSISPQCSDCLTRAPEGYARTSKNSVQSAVADSPVPWMNSSTISRAASSLNCTGGDFMK